MKRCIYCDSLIMEEESEMICGKCKDALERVEERKSLYILSKFPFEEENQIIKISLDGQEKNAEVLAVITIDEKKVAIYSVEEGENVNVFAAYIETDDEGIDHLIDIEDIEIKTKIKEYIESMVEE